MSSEEIRWKKRFKNFQKALLLLEEALNKYLTEGISELEEQGLIQRFEFTHELAWKVLKDYFEYQGNTLITGSRNAVREAFKNGLIDDGEGWMEMIKSRNLSSYTYNETIAKEIVKNIVKLYISLFKNFNIKMSEFYER